MNVELPDGTVLQDVPEGTTRAQVSAKLRSSGRASLADALDKVAPAPRRDVIAAAVEKASPADGMSAGEKLLVGAGAATDRAIRGLTGVAKSVAGAVAPGNVWSDSPDAGAEDAALYQKNHPGGWATAGEIGGDIAMSAIPVAGVAGKLSRLPLAMRTLGRAAPLAGDVAANAGYAAATAPEDRGTAAALGAGGAAVGSVLTKALARAARPSGQLGAEAQTLVDVGVKPTFGQVMGGAAKKAEDLATNVPVIGSLITKRRQEAQVAFQKATRDAALPPGASSEAVQSVDQLAKAFSDAYEGALQSTPFPKQATSFDPLATVARMAEDHPITDGQVAQAERFVMNTFKANMSDDATAASAHRIESLLKSKAYQYKSSSDASQRDLGGMLHDVASEWGQTWRGALPAEARQAIGAIDSQYARFVPVRRAAGKGSATTIDEITPSQMLTAIRQGDRTPNKTRFIAGGMPQQELATAAQNVIGSKVPEPGFFPQLAGVGAVGGVGALFGLSPQVIGGALLGLGYSTKTAQAYLTGQLAPNAQRAIDEALRSALVSGGAAQVGRATATQVHQ